MKNLALYICLWLLCACTDSFITESHTENSVICFDTGNINSKGISHTNQTLNSMALYGYYSAEAAFGSSLSGFVKLFDKQKLQWNASGNWQYTPPQYWMAKGYHHFFAFAPFDEINAINQDGNYPAIQVVIPPRAKNQKDILWSLGNTINRVASSKRVFFQMQHALTRITFSGALSSDYKGDNICVEQIRFTNLYQKAQSEVFFSGQTVESARWITFPDSQTDFFAKASTLEEYGALKSSLWFTSTQQSLMNKEESFFLLPQSFDNRDSNIEIHFRGKHDQILRIATIPLSGQSVFSSSLPWTPGTSIDYKLTYNGNVDTPFSISAKATPWYSQDVEMELPATYLSIGVPSLTLPVGTGFRIRVSTDGYPLSLSSQPQLNTLLHFDPNDKNGYIEIPPQTSKGNYTLSVMADRLKRDIVITVK